MKRSLDVDDPLGLFEEPQRANEQKARLLNLLGDMVLCQQNALVNILQTDTRSDIANLAPTSVEVSNYVRSLTVHGAFAARSFIFHWERTMNNSEPWTIQDVRAVGVLHFLMAIFINKVHIHETEDVMTCACCRCALGNEKRWTWVMTTPVAMEVFICMPCSRLSDDERLVLAKQVSKDASTASSASASTASSASTADNKSKPPTTKQ
jgi:hypothetical protein